MLHAMKDVPVRPEAERSELSFRAGIEGVRWVFRQPLIRSTMLLDFATFFASAQALLPIFAQDVLKVGPRGYGLLVGAPAMGAMLTSILMVPLVGRIERRGRVLMASVVAYALATVAFIELRPNVENAGDVVDLLLGLTRFPRPFEFGQNGILGGRERDFDSIPDLRLFPTPELLSAERTVFSDDQVDLGGVLHIDDVELPPRDECLVGAPGVHVEPRIAQSANQDLEGFASGLDDDIRVVGRPRAAVVAARHRANDHVGNSEVLQKPNNAE